MSSDLTEKIRKAAVLNAIRHDGKADPGAVLGNLLGENADLRPKAKEMMQLLRPIVAEVNSSPLNELKREASEKWPEDLVKEKVEEERKLPPLPNADKYSKIVTRVAPNPDFVLHIGNTRAGDTEPRLRQDVQGAIHCPIRGHRPTPQEGSARILRHNPRGSEMA